MKKRIGIVLAMIILMFILIFIGYRFLFCKNNKSMEDEKVYRCSYYNNPIIPEGFKKVETDTASWKTENDIPKGWNNGLVIEDEIGNQFVWIPVIDDNDKEYIISDNKEEIQLFKYGGFYVSRFEAGVPEDLQSNLNNISSNINDIIGIPVSKKNTISWNYISYNNANESAKLMYNSKNVKSELMSLNKYTILINWLQQSGYDVNNSSKWGNYSNTAFRFSGLYSEDTGNNYKMGDNILKDNNMILATGITDRNMANNIYDLAGNLREYTNTQFEDTQYHFSVGGYYAKSGDSASGGGSASEKYAYSNDAIGTTGFRICLYMQ